MVLHTVEAAVWGLLTTDSFEEAVVQVVNLGGDADTAGTVVGARSVDKNWRTRDLGCVRWQAVEPGSLWHKARPIPEAL